MMGKCGFNVAGVNVRGRSGRNEMTPCKVAINIFRIISRVAEFITG